MKLGNIADIGMGLVISRKKVPIESESNKEYTSITLKSVDEFGIIDKNLVDKFNSSTEIEESYLSKKGDVIIKLAAPYTAVAIDKLNEGLVVPSHFAKINLNTNEIKPEFLALYLNSNEGKKQIRKNIGKSATPSITVKDIKNIIIKSYDIGLQDKVVLINKLYIKENKLINELIKEKEKLNTSIIDDLLK